MRRKKWLIGGGIVLLLGIGAAWMAALVAAKRFEPYIRDQAVQYLSKRFDSEVEFAAINVSLPATSPFRLLITKGRGAMAAVEGRGISMRHKGRRDVPPMFAMDRFRFDVDVGRLFDTPKIVPRITLDGLTIHVPPKGERPALGVSGARSAQPPNDSAPPAVVISEVIVRNAKLVILPKDRSKVPLDFDIHHLRLESIGAGQPLKYNATLTNPKPPGEIQSHGTFGPWSAGEPAETLIAGRYTLEKADLGVFAGIAGILNSTGSFDGSLGTINARGEASIPDFRLKMSGNRVPLSTRFDVVVDGTNGNTHLKPVIATLGTTQFTSSGGVIKHDGDVRRTVSLDVKMPRGDLKDVLRLAMRGEPFMQGQLALKTKIDIPPLTSKVREKLVLDGEFEVLQGKFLRSSIQDQIDGLSRRGQGQPDNRQIDEVISYMAGEFNLENEVITFHNLAFGVPGAHVGLAGSYNLDGDVLDLRGSLRLAANVSQTMSGWKRWALKPVDPFFAKRGAGTFLKIKVDGTSREPKFGLDRGGDSEQKGGRVADRKR
jgi:hypothetical protein